MAATFAWSESNGAGETVTDGISNTNFGNTDGPNLSSPNNRVVAGQNSFEKWLRGRYSGTFTTISNLRFWKSAGSLPSGVTIKADVDAVYATPTDSASSVATVDVPTVEGSALTPAAPSGNPDYSGYITMQMQTTGAATPGTVPTQTFTLKYIKVLPLMVTLVKKLANSVKLLLGQYRAKPIFLGRCRDYVPAPTFCG